jgi:serine/threonine protein kinase/Tol biopolymer transport system component
LTAEQRELIGRLFEEASALPAAERAAWLAHECDDAEVLREVESLLPFAGADNTGLAAPVREIAALLPRAQPAPGDRIGPYEVLSLIGRGGMGEVYRARDTKLKRDVALKILPPEFARDPERLARFQREAEVLASLNHPNIASIYGVEKHALVMELVEGESPKGPLDFDEAWKIAAQVAAGLEYAHERRVVHRDLKPANLKVTPDGRVKILDFGVAKALAGETLPAPGDKHEPALSPGATELGVILGTAAYMAPEQAKGKAVDRRADIWALGVVLYELLTGEPLFQGRDSAEVMAHVLSEEPSIEKAPAKVQRLLRECLKKDPDQRLRWVGDVGRFLEEPPQAADLGHRWVYLAWIVASALLVALAAVSLLHFRETPPERNVINATILPPAKASFDFATGFNVPALSPDGRRVVFGAREADGKTQLWTHSLDSPAAQPLAGTENARFPFWSPDSQSVGFFADGKLKRMEVAGGPALTLAEAPDGIGGSWSPDGVIVFAPSSIGPLQRVAAAGGAPILATTLHGTNDFSHRFPWFLPDGRHFLFEDQTQFGSNDVTLQIGTLDSNEVKTVGPSNSNGLYSSGYLLYLRESTLVSQPFDVTRLAITGEAVPVAEQVRSELYLGGVAGLFSVSQAGLLAYQAGAGAGGQRLTWFDRTGKPVGSVGDASDFFALELSPDHKSLADTRLGQNVDLWIYDVARGLPKRFTFSPARDRQAIWSPDGGTIVYQSNPKGVADLYRKAADGTMTEELLYADGAEKVATSWSPDGKFLLFFRLDSKTQRDIWVLPLEGGPAGAPAKPIPWLVTPFNERFPRFSPDGRWVAYESDDWQRFEIYVAPFKGPGGTRQISTGGGMYPRWRADGKEIFYVGANGTLMAAEVSLRGASLEVDAIRPLGIPVITGRVYMYDVSSDGQRFLVAAPLEQKSSAPLTLVENWTALLKKK